MYGLTVLGGSRELVYHTLLEVKQISAIWLEQSARMFRLRFWRDSEQLAWSNAGVLANPGREMQSDAA